MITVPLFNGQKYPVPSRPLSRGPAVFHQLLTKQGRIPQSRAGGQGPYLRSVEHLGKSSMAKKTINAEKVV